VIHPESATSTSKGCQSNSTTRKRIARHLTSTSNNSLTLPSSLAKKEHFYEEVFIQNPKERVAKKVRSKYWTVDTKAPQNSCISSKITLV